MAPKSVKFRASVWALGWLLLTAAPPCLAQEPPTLRENCRYAIQNLSLAAYHARRGAKIRWHRLMDRLRPKPVPSSGKNAPPPKANRVYNARNKNLPGSSDAPPTPVAVFEGPAVSHFIQAVYTRLDPDTATLSWAPTRYSVWNPPDAGGTLGTLTRLQPDGEDLPLPKGWLPTALQKVFSNQGGMFQSPENKILFSDAQQVHLTPKQRRELTKVIRIPLEAFPQWLQSEVEALKSQRAYLSRSAIAGGLRKMIQTHLDYAKGATPALGVVEAAHCGAVQCDLAATLWTYLMRAEFQIPAQVVAGVPASQNPKMGPGSYLLSGVQGHAWGQYYDETLKKWIDEDPTPPSADDPSKKGTGDWKPVPTDQDQPEQKPERKPQPEDQGEEEDPESRQGQKDESTPDPLKKLKQAKIQEDASLRALWAHTLSKTIASPHQAEQTLRNFEKEMAQFPQASFAQQFPAALDKLRRLSAARKSRFQSPYELARELRSGTSEVPIDTLEWLHTTLDELSHARPLEPEESRAFLELQEMLNSRMQGTQLSDAKLGQHLYQTLPGPLSRHYVESTLGLNFSTPEAFAKFAGEFNQRQDLEPIRRVSLVQPYLKLATVNDKRRGQVKVTDPSGEIDSAQPWGISKADPRSPERLGNQGMPQKLELVLGLAGQLNAYGPLRSEEIAGGARFQPSTTEVLVLDLSGSMRRDNRIKLVNAFAAGLLDGAVQNRASKVILLPYRGEPEAPIHLKGADAFRATFNQMMQKDIFQSGGENDTAAALSKAMELAALEDSSRRINVRLVTDGDETFDSRAASNAIQALSAHKTVNLSLISLAVGNEAMAALAKEIAQKALSVNTQIVHHHISTPELKGILKQAENGVEVPTVNTALLKRDGRLANAIQSLTPTDPTLNSPEFAPSDWAAISALREKLLRSWANAP